MERKKWNDPTILKGSTFLFLGLRQVAVVTSVLIVIFANNQGRETALAEFERGAPKQNLKRQPPLKMLQDKTAEREEDTSHLQTGYALCAHLGCCLLPSMLKPIVHVLSKDGDAHVRDVSSHGNEKRQHHRRHRHRSSSRYYVVEATFEPES